MVNMANRLRDWLLIYCTCKNRYKYCVLQKHGIRKQNILYNLTLKMHMRTFSKQIEHNKCVLSDHDCPPACYISRTNKLISYNFYAQPYELHVPYFILFALVHCDLHTEKVHTCTVESKHCQHTGVAKPNDETDDIFTLFCLVTYAAVYCSAHKLQVTCPLKILMQQRDTWHWH